MYFPQKQMELISREVREVLQKGYVEPHKSLKIKEIFDKYREGGNNEIQSHEKKDG